MYYKALFQRLNQRRVKYVVCGGVAVNILGVPRYTKDTDLLVDFDPSNLRRLWDALISLGYRPLRPVSRSRFVSPGGIRWLREEKHAVVFTFQVPEFGFMSVDVLLESPVSYARARKGAENYQVGSVRIPTIAMEDLIRMKKKAQREQDVSDIRALKQVKKNGGAKKKTRARR
ncbi:hypothetical protein HY522_07835 [bacterium]|nr:hypothetical protein [bacterium]